jgi:hypothetical protein
MTCKVDHTNPDNVPVWLCRQGCGVIHNATPAEVRASDAAERKAVATRVKHDSQERQARVLELKIEKLTPNTREPRVDSVSGKLLVSYRRQLKKLRAAIKRHT